MNYTTWSDQDRFGSDRFGSVPTSVQIPVQISVRISVRTYSLLYALLPVILLIQEIYLAYQIIPSIVSLYPYRNGTATHACLGMCYGRAPSGNGQLPKVVLHNY